MKEMSRISDAEWEVMKVLWTKSPMSASEVIEALAGVNDWSPKTIRTLLTRLVQKEVITLDSNSKPYVYSPLVTEDETTRAETESFLKRLYGSVALKPMLVNFLKYEKLSKEDIDELKSILDERKE
ncbi:BlaI/MecI/CopY family transcriptional regulator [Paenibacillus sp. JDR-2]|uniref:BlaI/MecI/CopY family transcriptional regulator n=1 Tax=Paenibacillus sp. (strain JDR-2) TaxID=324057 RepID=UPI0001664A58|nr:BlaI/MecI/CopY family transcriptional regulator [Paenibacillus sp. JDR-2]ACT04210.1 transcriptional repressor, CopY family [Paenibacillus sp. JDR-2]